MPRSELKLPVDELLAPPPEVDVDAMWQRQVAALDRTSAVAMARKRRRNGGAAAALLATAAATLLIVRMYQPGPLRLADGAELPGVALTTDAPRTVAFEDESTLVLAPDSGLAVEENTPERLVLRLTAGSLTNHVKPGGERQWVVLAGKARVTVVGTRYQVSLLPDDAVSVAVQRGTVEVRYPGQPSARLQAGESVVVGATDNAQQDTHRVAHENTHEDTREEDQADTGRAPTPAAKRTAKATAPVRGRSWHRRVAEVADMSATDAAQRAAARLGVFDRPLPTVVRGLTARQIMQLSDLARQGGYEQRALELLEDVAVRRPDHALAPAATFALARLLLKRGEATRAARHFRTVSNAGTASGLREEAMALEAAAWARAGQLARAKAVAERYLMTYPQGRHAQELGQLSGAN